MIAVRSKRVKDKLINYLNPQYLEIIDESHLHATHKHFARNEEETHIKIIIACDQFVQLSRIKQHKIIYNLLQDELSNGLHAVSIDILVK